MTSLAAAVLYAITCTTGFMQDAGKPVQEMCVVQINGAFDGYYEGECKDVGEALYERAKNHGKAPTLIVNGFDYNRV